MSIPLLPSARARLRFGSSCKPSRQVQWVRITSLGLGRRTLPAILTERSSSSFFFFFFVLTRASQLLQPATSPHNLLLPLSLLLLLITVTIPTKGLEQRTYRGRDRQLRVFLSFVLSYVTRGEGGGSRVRVAFAAARRCFRELRLAPM